MSKTISDRVYQYKIDEHDRIIEVSDNWNDFAADNEASNNCFYPNLISKSLWDFIADKETENLYMMAIEKVRTTNSEIKIPIRCDSPELIRHIEIAIYPLSENHIQFSSKINQIISRDPVQLLDFYVDRSDESVKICSYCKQVEVSENNWAEVEQAIIDLDLFGSHVLPRLTHGVCPTCYDSIMEKIK